MLSWKDYYYEREKRADQIAQAARQRQIDACRSRRRIRFRLAAVRMLKSFGIRLERWGQKLQCRCSEIIASKTKRPTSLQI